jgi:hypothetical protein
MHEQEPIERPERPGLDEGLARRLDALSRVEAERVLERAIRIQSQKQGTEQFTPEQIRRIAAELGVDGSVVDRALREEVTAAPPPAKASRLFPARIVDRAVVPGSEEAVAEQITGWMENDEGLRAVAPVAGGLRWEKDTHWTTATRLVIGSDGTKALRGMPEVVHRQTSLGPDEQLVELEVETDRIRNTAWGVGAGVAAAALASGAVVAAAAVGGSDLLEFASAAVPGLALATASAIVIARAWTTSIRRGMRRALDGIAHPELHRRAWRRRSRRIRRSEERRPRSGLQRLIDEVADALDDIFD